MDMQRIASEIDPILETCRGKRVICFVQDRCDLDAQASVAVFDHILREKYESKATCFYSKQPTFLMNRRVESELLSGMFQRTEESENLDERIESSPIITVFDAINFGMISSFSRVLNNDEFKEGSKPILLFDHHLDSNEAEEIADESPSAYGEKVKSIVLKAGANTSIMLSLMGELGVEFDPSNEKHKQIAMAAHIGIKIDTEQFKKEYLTKIDEEACDTINKLLDEEALDLIGQLEEIRTPVDWIIHKGRAFSHCRRFDSSVAAYGIGVIDDAGIIPYVADALKETGFFTSVIVFGITHELIDGKLHYVNLTASGRTVDNKQIDLLGVFKNVFYIRGKGGQKISKGGGRSSGIFGASAMTGAEIPLSHLLESSVGDIRSYAWPMEAKKIRRRLMSQIKSLEKELVVLAEFDCENG